MELSEIGVTGPYGSIGSRLVARGMLPLDFDITDKDDIVIPRNIKYVINCAALTDVDYCEANKEKAFDVNYRATLELAFICEQLGVRLLQISSDHVFGEKFWFLNKETTIPNPMNNYGWSKMASEAALVGFDNAKIVRTSVVFSDKHLSIKESEAVLEVTNVIKKTFMYVEDFVDCLVYHLEHWNDMPKRLHISGTKRVSWYEFTKYIRDRAGLTGTVYPRNVYLTHGFTPRPRNSGLDVSLAKRLGVPVRSYIDGIERWDREHVQYCFPDRSRL